MNNYKLDKYCREIAAEAIGTDDPEQSIWESVDGSEHVIYYHKAHAVCANCDVSQGETFLEETGGIAKGDSYDSIATKIVFGEMLGRAQGFLAEMQEESA